MSPPITPCSSMGHFLEGDFDLSRFFTMLPNYSAYTFNKNMQQIIEKGFKIDLKTLSPSGRTMMGTLAMTAVGSNLMRYIASQDPSVVDLGDSDGKTPLFYAAYLDHLDSAKTLLELGANVNIATIKKDSQIPVNATALWAAIEKTKSVALIKLLLRHGAAYQLPLSVEGQGRLNQAKAELAEQRAAQMREIQAGTSTAITVQAYPTVLVDLIQSYV